MGKILIVEDEEKIARFVELELVHEGYAVDKAADGRAGVEAALAEDYDLILLDVMLPGLNGLEVLRRVRKVKQTPVILLTARDAVMDKVAGLDAGADDYITKPFAVEELLARVRVALKHRASVGEADGEGPAAPEGVQAQAPVPAPAAPAFGPQPASAAPSGPSAPPRPQVLVAGPVALDPGSREVTVGGEPVALTNREFEVLRALLENKNLVMTRDQLARVACGYDYVGETNIIDVYVRRIRSKIDDRFGVELVTTVRGVGYVVRER